MDAPEIQEPMENDRDLQRQAMEELHGLEVTCLHNLMFWTSPGEPTPSADALLSARATKAESQLAFWSSALDMVELSIPRIGRLRQPDHVRVAMREFRLQWVTLASQSGLWPDADDQVNP